MGRQYDIVSVTFDRDDRRYVSIADLYSTNERFWSADGSTVKKMYDYRAPRGLLQAGDQAVVDSPYGTAVVTVRVVNGPGHYRGVLKQVVCKVDRTGQRRQELEARIEELSDEINGLLRKRATAFTERRALIKELAAL